MTYIYNLCIDQNIFPTALKEAKVIPIPKGTDTTDPLNFRPISILPILSKPLEKHIQIHLYKHLHKHSLIHPLQSGFRPLHSCQTALINICDTWLTEINSSNIIGSVFLDFRKAFDLVNHSILIRKCKLYFPESNAVNLIESYLADRFQYVSIDEKHSSKGKIVSGIPQGSILGPLLFLLYINDIPLHLKNEQNNITNDIFADDTTIHTSNKDIRIINSTLQKGLDCTNDWCHMNNMKIHPDKTKAMVITTRQKHQLSPLALNLTLGPKKIEQVNTHKLLGLKIDSELNWHDQIYSLSKKMSTNIFLLSQLKKFASQKSLKLFFEAHINSHINYISTVWDGCGEEYLKKINSLHRRGIKKIITNQQLTTEQKYKSLNILPFYKQLKYNKAIITHKIYLNLCPPYLKKLIQRAPNRYGSKKLILPLPRIDLFKTSFSYSGPKTWNSLPNSISSATSLTLFKKQLHKYLSQDDFL